MTTRGHTLCRFVPVRARTSEEGNRALLLEKVRLGRRPYLPCPSRWICVPRRIMATTSRMRQLLNESLLYAPAAHRSRARTVRPWRVGGNQNQERRFHFLFSKTTIRLSDWTWRHRGWRHRSDTKITFLARDAALCAARTLISSRFQSDAAPWFRWERGSGLCRFARHNLTSRRGRIDLGTLLHRRFDFDVRSLNRWKNSRFWVFQAPVGRSD